MKKIIRYILLCLPLVLLMSHNSFAAEVTFDAQVKVGNFPTFTYYCATYAPQGYSISGQCNQRYWVSNSANQIRYDSGNTSIAGIKFFTPSGYTGAYNDLIQYEFDIMQGSGAANNAIDISLITMRSNTSTFDVIDVSAYRVSNNTTHVKVLLWAKGNFSSNTPIILIPANVETANSNYYETNFIWFRETGDLVSGGLVNVFHIRSSSQNTPFDDTDVLNSIEEVKDAIENSQNSEADATQDAADAAQDAADDSTSSAESATTGLINVISGFVGVITSASPSNCVINGHINNNFDMGNLDLCAMPAPPFIQIIGSLILISVCIPFCIIMFNRFIGLFRSFQG